MKKITYLFGFVILLSLFACEKNTLSNKNIGTIEGQIFQMMEVETSELPDGMYKANFEGKEINATVQNGVLKWFIPNSKTGKFALTIEQNHLNYELTVHVKENESIQSVENYLLEFAKEEGLDLTEKQILEMPVQSQKDLAQFIKVNKTQIINGLKEQKKQEQQYEQENRLKTYTSLAVGASTTFNVLAANRWNSSSVSVNSGEQYQVTATGIWTDWFIDSDADGYSNCIMDLVGFLRRAPNQDWFKLIGSVDRSQNYPVGISGTIAPTQSGNLEFYANDISCFYWNNCGDVTVTITRTL